MTTTASTAAASAAPTRTRRSGGSGRSGTRTLARTPRAFYWMVVPAVLLFALLHTIPVLTGVFFSFTNYAGYGDWSLIGLGNYIALFQDDRIWSAYAFTFGVAIVATLLTNVIALALALGLNARIKARNFFRGVFFIPYVLAVLVVGYVFQFLFSNSLPKLFPGVPVLADNILTNPDWAWVAIVFLTVWQSVAFSTIIYISGLQTIPGELYEAAALDGAGAWKRFFRITFPLIGPFFTINMVLSMKNFLQIFDPIVALTNGGPGTSTESITMVIYRGGFQGGEYGYQTANAVVYFIVIVLISIIQLRFLQRRDNDLS